MQRIIHKNLFMHTTKCHHVRDLFVATINVPETNYQWPVGGYHSCNSLGLFVFLVSQITGLEYRMEQWNEKCNGTVNGTVNAHQACRRQIWNCPARTHNIHGYAPRPSLHHVLHPRKMVTICSAFKSLCRQFLKPLLLNPVAAVTLENEALLSAFCASMHGEGNDEEVWFTYSYVLAYGMTTYSVSFEEPLDNYWRTRKIR